MPAGTGPGPCGFAYGTDVYMRPDVAPARTFNAATDAKVKQVYQGTVKNIRKRYKYGRTEPKVA